MMKRRMVLSVLMALSMPVWAVDLPGEPCTREPLPTDPFPDALSAYVWRNWGLVPKDILAKAVYTTPEAITEIATDFGLPPNPVVLPEWRRKGYITILRRNWHLLPYNQLLNVVGMTREELRFSLIEDDFLFVKLGNLKPKCPEIFATPEVIAGGRDVRRRLGAILKEEGLDPSATEEPRFSFVHTLSALSQSSTPVRSGSASPFDFRMIFSYFADYGDPLGDSEIGSYPEGLLQKLSVQGVNAVWLHTVLRTIAKDPKYPEFGEGSERRIANLRTLVARAEKYGIKVFLYMNEPRGMPAAFYEKNAERKAMRGVAASENSGIYAMCTAHPETLRWVHDAVRQVFSAVPGLGGIFTITMSENLTHCASRQRANLCPHCKERKVTDIIAEVNNAIISGMREGNPDAQALVWDWAWPNGAGDAESICEKIDKRNCRIMSVSENRMSFVRGGVKGVEGDYSISIVGPGESAKHLWNIAKVNGIKRVAKVQANCSWELSPFPYLPVMDLVAEHAANLAKADVSGVMLSWSCGCCPAPNLRIFNEFRSDDLGKDPVLDRLAAELYPGKVKQVRAAWAAFSNGFREYPFSIPTAYDGPQHWGVAAPLYVRPTGYKATMVGIPYDDLVSWRAQYPADIWINQMQKVADGFKVGCQLMAGVADVRELAMFRAQQMHFAETADLARFILARDAGDLVGMKRIAKRQLQRAKEYWPLVCSDSRIGYESSNHYFFTPNDVLEKVWCCRQVLSTDKLAPPKTCVDGKRPYEMVWANRRADEVPPVDRLESGEGWRAEGVNAAARVSLADDRLLFGSGVLRFDYRATGKNPIARLRREAPLELPPFDTVSVWIYGNNFYGRPKDTPITQLTVDFVDADGKPFSFHLATILHREWCKFQQKVPKDFVARAKTGKCRLLGFSLSGGTNSEDRRLDITSFAAFCEELKPISFKPRAKRGIQVFSDAPQGVNVGEGRLPFPTVATTVIPVNVEKDKTLEFRTPSKPGIWDDLAFRIGKGPWVPLAMGGGVWPRSVANRAKVHWQRIGNSLVADVTVKGGVVEELRFGDIGVDIESQTFPIPFYKYGLEGWDERPQIVMAELKEGTRFISATLDWTQSNCSLPFPSLAGEGGVAANGGARYCPKTDGARNDVFERFVWTVSPRFEETLPVIPNPVSPWRTVTGRNAWIASGASGNRRPNFETFFWHHRNGLRHLIITDHESGWRDGDESFTFRVDPAPGRGGDKGQYDYARKLIDGFGYWYGPYNNFTDYAPVNGFWTSEYVGRKSDGNWHSAWARCTGPKPLYGLEMCEKLAPIIQRKFQFNTAYCDVHTAIAPWSRTDYDARVPGAGTFAQTFYAYGEIMLIQKKTWNGPVSSEGGHQWLYSGITDQNYGQDCSYQLMHHPWIVDFNLLRMHPLTCDHGGYAGMLFGDANVPKGSSWRVVEPWTAVTLAFGHSAFLLPENPTYAYYMVLAPASRYSQESVKAIRYADSKGQLLTTSEAVKSGEIVHNRVVVAYDAGTLVVVNGDPDAGWLAIPRGKGLLALPQWGFYCRGDDVVAYSGSTPHGTNRVDFCRGGKSDGYVYMHARGVWTEFPGGATDGAMVRLAETNNTEEIIPWGYSTAEIGLPYAAVRLVGLTGTTRQEVKEIPFRIDEKGWTRFVRDRACHSYRATLPADFTEPSCDVYETWVVKPKDFVVPPTPARPRSPRALPKRFTKGILTPEGREIPYDSACGGFVREGAAGCGGKCLPGLCMHPPYQNGFMGAVFARYVLTLDSHDLCLATSVGKMDNSTPGDGILFKVGLRIGDGPLRIIAEHRVKESRWENFPVDLSPYAGKKVQLYLISDPGGNTYGDGGGWSGLYLTHGKTDI